MKIIATGDMHLDGSKVPVCRTDVDYVATQIRKLQFIKEMKAKYSAIHIDAGDLLERAVGESTKDSMQTLKLVLTHLGEFYGIPGNHDEKWKSLLHIEDSLISIFMMQGNMIHIDDPIELEENVVLHGFGFGKTLTGVDEKYVDEKYINIALYHGYVGEEVNPFIDGLIASEIVDELSKDYDFIITADNHTPFVVKKNGCTLINVGSLLRTTIKQINYKPCIWLLDTETCAYEKLYVPIENDVISTAHKDIAEEKRNRMDSVVDVVGNSADVIVNYTDEVYQLVTANAKVMNDNVRLFIEKCLKEQE